MSDPYPPLEMPLPKNDESSSLKIGDVVTLNSGGPEMTVSKLSVGALLKPNEEAGVVCSWFDSHGQLTSATFLVATLKRKIIEAK